MPFLFLLRAINGLGIIIMLVSYKWLKELVDVDVTTAELAEKMSTTGIEVEGVETPAEGLSKIGLLVMSCHVKMCLKHTCTCAK